VIASNLHEAIGIILRTQPDTEADVHDSRLFCGEYKPDAMTPEERRRLCELGWYDDEDSWALDV
jgi:hypothetical protein